ncbi:MAG: tripartite tricarboxylate transporter substrate binding protein [Xanthobacteraceae bacterium]|nr:tripartite tricarboxylate transporter substrate binding protein [Xanthobacteraceae bacterium]
MTVLCRTLFAVFALFAASAAQAQTYPDRPIRLIAPFPAGGLADVLARAVGDEMSKTLGQPVIVENRAGAGGNTGADAVAKAAPDGYTLLMASAGILTANPFLYAQMPFNVETAFIPVSNVADMSMLVVVNPKVETKTLKEFVALAKAQPGKLNFGSPGIGTTGHLGLAMLMHAADLKIAHVPYRGAAPAITDLIAGQIDGVVDNPPTVISHIQSGTLRPLAVAAKERLALLPDVPTAAEQGVANYEASSWFGIAAPAGTPPAIIARLHQAIAAAVRTPAMQERFGKSGARLIGDSPKEFAARIGAERVMWGRIIKAANITP